MYKYAQYCPVAAGAAIAGDYWSLLIVRELLDGADRFNALVRTLPGISRSVLVQRLRRLEQAGVLERCVATKGRMTSYRLTPAGAELRAIIDALGAWGARWGLEEPALDNLDPVLLLWLLRRRITLSALPPRRVVVQIDIRGRKTGSCWYVLEPAEASLCFHHPGFEIDLLLRVDAVTLYRLWLGRTTMVEALRDELAHLDGPPALVRAFPCWFA